MISFSLLTAITLETAFTTHRAVPASSMRPSAFQSLRVVFGHKIFVFPEVGNFSGQRACTRLPGGCSP